MGTHDQRNSILRTLRAFDGMSGRTAEVIDKRLKRLTPDFLTELEEFTNAIRDRGVQSVIRTIGGALVRMGPGEFMAGMRPFLDHYLKLCDAVSPQNSLAWGTTCRGLILGLDHYTGHRNSTLSSETTEALLYAAAAVLNTKNDAPYWNSNSDYTFKRQVESTYSLPEGELLDLIVGHPEAAPRFSALLLRGKYRMAELIAVIESEAPLPLTEGAL